METRRLGRSGLTVPVVGLGTNNFGMKLDDSACRAVLDAALDQGITLIFLTVSSACMPQASTRLPSGTADPRRYLPVSSPEHKGK